MEVTSGVVRYYATEAWTDHYGKQIVVKFKLTELIEKRYR